jgi:hypothetical protein
MVHHLDEQIPWECLVGGPVFAIADASTRIVSPLRSPLCSEEGLTVHHLDERALRECLMQGSLADGLLQRFVMPFGDKNVQFTCYWYPNFFYMDRSSTFPR